ncbi:sulfur carrier protein [Litorivivens lipolytica]|uniref:Sulfur carrier protein n=1 Tax=Litorivivens lipolytica TaxID=1524264 RepID=A0A7W4W4L6_9GAMM|nr:sulfur carrier protein ThiS [Litorivivens lipolytica]MBB3047332.1 sulfur carrier protein [Litorivivens lipolytica]
MIEVSVNSESKQIDGAKTLAELLGEWGFECQRVAVAVNEDFVPRSTYASVSLKAGDRVDVVAPVQGG